MEVGEREVIYLSLHFHHLNDSCIKMGSNESFQCFSRKCWTKSQDGVHKPQPFEEKGEPKRNRTEVLPLSSL